MLVSWSSGEGDGGHEPPKRRSWGGAGVTVAAGGLVDGNMVVKDWCAWRIDLKEGK